MVHRSKHIRTMCLYLTICDPSSWLEERVKMTPHLTCSSNQELGVTYCQIQTHGSYMFRPMNHS